jgi:hypothetical protein
MLAILTQNKKNQSSSISAVRVCAALLSLGSLLFSVPSFAGTNAALFRVSLAIVSNADRPTPQRDVGSSHYTWGAAEVSLMNAGYAKPKRVEVVNEVYWFNTVNFGKPITIGVAMNSGEIVHAYQAAN